MSLPTLTHIIDSYLSHLDTNVAATMLGPAFTLYHCNAVPQAQTIHFANGSNRMSSDG